VRVSCDKKKCSREKEVEMFDDWTAGYRAGERRAFAIWVKASASKKGKSAVWQALVGCLLAARERERESGFPGRAQTGDLDRKQASSCGERAGKDTGNQSYAPP